MRKNDLAENLKRAPLTGARPLGATGDGKAPRVLSTEVLARYKG